MSYFSPMRWNDGQLELINQLELPGEENWISCTTVEAVGRAIKDMVVRGAPAIGCAAAYGIAIAARAAAAETSDKASFSARIHAASTALGKTRPTAVNLFWAIERMRRCLAAALEGDDVASAVKRLESEAAAIQREDLEQCLAIGRHGAELIAEGSTILTHCNTGALATAGFGTALGVIRAAHDQGKVAHVLADETRPYLQGARLTAWELHRESIPVTVIPDSAAAFLMARGEVSCAIVGADRIAANGDTANKIGTYSVAIAAHRHAVPFYVAAPLSTVDLDTASGDDIPIEERSGDEIMVIGGHRIAPRGVLARYPAFDVTPAELITAIITERGIARGNYRSALRRLSDPATPETC